MLLTTRSTRFSGSLARQYGGAATTSTDPGFRALRGDAYLRTLGLYWSKTGGGIPGGTRPPVAITLPLVDGGLSACMASSSDIAATAIVPAGGPMVAMLTAAGTITATPRADGALAADILPYTTNSAELVAYTVWNWPSEAAQSYGKQWRDMRSVLLGTTTGGGTTQEKFYAADGATVRVTSNNDGMNRTSVVTPGA